MDDFVNWLQSHGYARSSICNNIHGVVRLSRWLKRHPDWLINPNQNHLRLASDYFHKRKYHVATAIHVVRRFLRERAIIPEGTIAPKLPSEQELEAFGVYLQEVRGLATSTISEHQNQLRFFLRFLKFDENPLTIRTLRPDQVDNFLRKAAKTNNRFSLQHVVASVRGFLKHLHAQGVLKQALHQQLDTPRTYRLEQLPRALPWEQVVSLLRSIDRSQPDGLRDFTMLYLAARYGLRSGELVRLTLDHIDWRARTLQVPQTKTKQTLLLPLTEEAGAVLAHYLKAGRPGSEHRQLFVRRRAPAGPLAHTAVHDILAHRIRHSGLALPPIGTHVLRHSFAVHLLRRGVPMNDIGDVLGHRNCESTVVYLRLAVDDLREVGLPVPSTDQASPLDPSGWKRKLPRLGRPKRRPPLAKVDFGSGFAGSLRVYLANRRALGRRFAIEEGILRRWDDFLKQEFPRSHDVLPEMFHSWAKSMPNLTAFVRRNHLRLVRNFLLFHARTHPNTYVPDPATFPRSSSHQAPRLVTSTEMARILATAQQLPASYSNPLRAETIHLALVLLFCCGLRRGELLRLTLRHFDSTENLVRIQDTKFHKSRLVPLSRSVAQELRDYMELRRQHLLPVDPDSPIIWSNRRPAPADYYCAVALTANWQQLCLATGVVDGRGRPPRLHDLRHSFAMAALHRWYRQGVEVQAKLPHLATYMGHVCSASTHHYLHLTPDIGRAASQRFHQYAAEIFGHGGGK